jgi:hypothetical protein
LLKSQDAFRYIRSKERGVTGSLPERGLELEGREGAGIQKSIALMEKGEQERKISTSRAGMTERMGREARAYKYIIKLQKYCKVSCLLFSPSFYLSSYLSCVPRDCTLNRAR